MREWQTIKDYEEILFEKHGKIAKITINFCLIYFSKIIKKVQIFLHIKNLLIKFYKILNIVTNPLLNFYFYAKLMAIFHDL